MVAVCDKQRLAAQGLDRVLQYGWIRHSPELLTEPHIIAKIDRGRLPFDRRFQQAQYRSFRI